MNSREVILLKSFFNYSGYSQRQLADIIGISLGSVNNLIKKCVKRGLLEIEKENNCNVSYSLTPKGIKELTAKTLSYIKRSYREIKKIIEITREKAHEDIAAGRFIYLYGRKDEVYDIISGSLNEINIEYKVINDLDDIDETKREKVIIYYWCPELKEEIEEKLSNYCNILELKLKA